MDVGITEGVPEAAAARKALAHHTARRRLTAGRVARAALSLWGIGFVCVALLGSVVGAAATALLGTAFVVWLESRWVARASRRVLGDATAAVSLGRGPEAEGKLDALLETRLTPRPVRRAALVEQALLMLRRGETHLARTALDRAVALRAAAGGTEVGERASALGLRALVLAMGGREDDARADVEAAPCDRAPPAARGHVALAQALLAARAGDRDGVAAVLDAIGPAELDGVHPRERAVGRALRKWLRAPRSTPYRIAVARPQALLGDGTPDELAVGGLGWAPEGPGARWARSLAPDLLAPVPSLAGIDAVRAARGARDAAMWPLVAIAAGAFGVLGLLMTRADPTATGPSWLLVAVTLLVAATTAGTAGFAMGARVLARLRDRTALGRVLAGAAHDETPAALAHLSTSSDAAIAATAALALACAAERRGRWDEVLAHTESGLRRLPARTGPSAPDLAAPLASLRAFALAIAGRRDEAHAELASLGRGYGDGPRALFRVRLVDAIARGRWAEARAHSDRHLGDMPLSVREEALVDVVRVVQHATSAAEAVRIRDDLRRDPEVRAWLVSVAPALIEALDDPQGASEAHDDVPSPAEEDAIEIEGEAEREASADDEAHQGSSSASTARFTS